MDGMEVEVGGNDVGVRVVRRMLRGAKILQHVIVRHDDHAAGMLTGGALDTGTAAREAVDLRLAVIQPPLLHIPADIAERGLIRHGGDGTSLEHVIAAEQRFGVFMRAGLVFTREVQIDIRRLIAVEAEEGFKRNLVAVPAERLPAHRAVFIRQIEAGTDRPIREKFVILALFADVMRFQRVNL